MPDENPPFKIPADDVERANIGTVNPDCPQCSVWGFECKLPKCGPQVHEKGTHEFAGLGEAAWDFAKSHFDSMSKEPRAFKLDERGTIVPNPEFLAEMEAPKLDDLLPPHLRMDRKPVISTLTGERLDDKPVTSLNYCARASLAKQPWKCPTCQREIFSKESHIKGCVGREIYTDDGKPIIPWSAGTWPMNSKTYPVHVEKKPERFCTCHPADRAEFDECQGGFTFDECCRIANDKKNPGFGEGMLPGKVIAFLAIAVVVLMGIFYHD